MEARRIRQLLQQVQKGRLGVEEALEKFRYLPDEDLGFSKIDSHRALRRGFPEVIYCQGKTPGQIEAIVDRMVERESDVLATRCPSEVARTLVGKYPRAVYHELSKAFTIERRKKRPRGGLILVISAGTADIPVAEEALVTARMMGNRAEPLYDVGVAGIHRLLRRTELLQQARTIVVAAGMEGALPSVVSGLVEAPVVAVPRALDTGRVSGASRRCWEC
jgi:NCAIR mutase (PurE)-related protein